MKYKLSTILITLALIAASICACYPVTGNDSYRTMPLGTGTLAPVLIVTEPITESPEITAAETTLTPDITEKPDISEIEETTVNVPDITTAPPETEPDVTTEQPPEDPVFEYDVLEEITDIGTVGKGTCRKIIRYPEIKNYENTSTQNKINKLLSQIASVEYQNRLPNAEDLVKGGTYVTYEITETAITFLGNNIASVRSEGKIDYKDDTKDERFVYCNTFDLSKSKDITLKKTYTDFAKIITLFTSGKFKQISGDPSLTSSLSLTQLMEQYKYHAQYGTYPETYFTKDSLILVIETNIENGFFAEFSIALSEVNDCLVQSPTK